jgi:hypothetical protein
VTLLLFWSRKAATEVTATGASEFPGIESDASATIIEPEYSGVIQRITHFVLPSLKGTRKLRGSISFGGLDVRGRATVEEAPEPLALSGVLELFLTQVGTATVVNFVPPPPSLLAFGGVDLVVSAQGRATYDRRHQNQLEEEDEILLLTQ